MLLFSFLGSSLVLPSVYHQRSLDGHCINFQRRHSLWPSPSLAGSVAVWYRLTEKLEKGGFLNPAYLPWPPAAFREVSSLWGAKQTPLRAAVACPGLGSEPSLFQLSLRLGAGQQVFCVTDFGLGSLELQLPVCGMGSWFCSLVHSVLFVLLCFALVSC